MSILAWIRKQRKQELAIDYSTVEKQELETSGLEQTSPQNALWVSCESCGVILYRKHLKEKQHVCLQCGSHLRMSSMDRIESLIDNDSWRPLYELISPCDPLDFKDSKTYPNRLKSAQKLTGFQDAVETGTGLMDGIPIALGVMDFEFMGGSMGSVVGEKITRLIEYATKKGLTLVLVCASGGARMQEGTLSLMQMGKISAALEIHQCRANLLYISILTSPTTGGVTASFGMLGDLIIAEPKATIGFAGRRVIEGTLNEKLPEDFQTAESFLQYGLVDLIVPRCFLKCSLVEFITFNKQASYRKNGIIPPMLAY